MQSTAKGFLVSIEQENQTYVAYVGGLRIGKSRNLNHAKALAQKAVDTLNLMG
jgi:hypothetical protein